MRRFVFAVVMSMAAFPLLARSHGGRVEGTVLVDGAICSVTGADIDDVRDLKRAYGRAFFWFMRDGRAWLVRDAEVLRELHDLYQPQVDLGRQQAALGSKQAALGVRQAALGAEQARIGMRQIGDDDPALAARQRELSEKQNELGRQQNELGQKQSILGGKQEALSRDIEGKLGAIVDELIRRGVAREVPR